jgi:hypothetical protein
MLAFMGSGAGRAGIYRRQVSGLKKLVDDTTRIPSGGGLLSTFQSFGDPCMRGEDVAFRGEGSGQEGIYTIIDGALARVADRNTSIPEGSGRFTGFGVVSFDGTNVAFVGEGPSGQKGIYTDLGGSLVKVIDVYDRLENKRVSNFYIGRQALSGGAIAFKADFTDGTSGLFAAGLHLPPAPAPVASVQRVSGDVGVELRTDAGNRYRIEYTDNLRSGRWGVLTNITGTGEAVIAEDAGHAGSPCRYYRVVREEQ